jgi:hypothetical protein
VAGLESVQGEHGYLPAGRLPGLVVQASMLASEDAAESGLVRAARRLAKLGVTPMTTVNAAVRDAERAQVLLRIGVLSVPLRRIGSGPLRRIGEPAA